MNEILLTAATETSAHAGQAVSSVIDSVTGFASAHPIITTVLVGFAAVAIVDKVSPMVTPVTEQLNEWRKDAQGAVANMIQPTDRIAANSRPIPLAAPVALSEHS